MAAGQGFLMYSLVKAAAVQAALLELTVRNKCGIVYRRRLATDRLECKCKHNLA